ncbi:MucBP domain-containing protein [Leuconostoc carnosum]|uniref:MucBP domain-containing protein n=1 Tax=Leuconostoc carnosum TaxID=1252 RepID=UPI00272E91E8|nr:MucBP domain-containing protein [Leuconostoc carnosum]WLC59069.1 MucBP domain-containing protein [Leuconostoc carnosum]
MEKRTKQHYKMYKSGKHWIYATMFAAAIGLGGVQQVSADEAIKLPSSATTLEKPTDKEPEPATTTLAKPADKEPEPAATTLAKPADKEPEPATTAPEKPVDKEPEPLAATPEKQANKEPEQTATVPEKPVVKPSEQPTSTPEKQLNKQSRKTVKAPTKQVAKQPKKATQSTIKPANKESIENNQTPADATQTTWARDKSAVTGNSDSNKVTNEAGEYWPKTKGNSIKKYTKTETKDLLQTTVFSDGYNPTPVLKNSNDLSLYIKGQKVDIGTLQDDDSLGSKKSPNPDYPGHESQGHSRLLKTSDLGSDTYFFAKNVMQIKNATTNKYESYDMKWTLQSVNYSNEESMIALGIKGSVDGGGTTLLNIGSGWQIAHLGNFFNTHIQFFNDINYADKNEHLTPDEAIKQRMIEASAVSMHFGVSDVDSNEAIELTESVIKKTYVDKNTQLAYQKTNDGYLAVTRKYNDTADVSDPKNATAPINEKRVTVLFEMDVPKEGFDYSVATVGTKENKSGEYQLGQGSKVAPSLLSTMKYEEPLTVNYVDIDGKALLESKNTIGLIGDAYNQDFTQKVDIPRYHLVDTIGNPKGNYVDGNNEITYVYAKDQGNLIVNYVDEAGQSLADSDQSTQDSGESYTTQAKGIDGYDVVTVPSNEQGKYPADKGTTEVTYVYGKQGTHTTKYQDEQGNELVPSQTTQGPKDSDYQSPAVEVPGYHLVPSQTTGDTPTGKYDTGKPTATTYVYAKDQGNLIVNYVDEAGQSLADSQTGVKKSIRNDTPVLDNKTDIRIAKQDDVVKEESKKDLKNDNSLPNTSTSNNNATFSTIVGLMLSTVGLATFWKRRKK